MSLRAKLIFEELPKLGKDINEILLEFSEGFEDINNYKKELLKLLPDDPSSLTKESLEILKDLELEPIHSIIEMIWYSPLHIITSGNFCDYEIEISPQYSNPDNALMLPRQIAFNGTKFITAPEPIKYYSNNENDCLGKYINDYVCVKLDFDGYAITNNETKKEKFYSFDKNIIRYLYKSLHTYERFEISKDGKTIAVFYSCKRNIDVYDNCNNFVIIFNKGKYIGDFEYIDNYKYFLSPDGKYFVYVYNDYIKILDIYNNFKIINYPLKENPNFPGRWYTLFIENIKMKSHDPLSYKLRNWNLDKRKNICKN